MAASWTSIISRFVARPAIWPAPPPFSATPPKRAAPAKRRFLKWRAWSRRSGPSVRISSVNRTALILKPHHLHSRIDEQQIAGHPTAEIAGQKHGRVRNLCGIYVAAKRRALGHHVEDRGEVLHGPGRRGFDRTS